MISRPQLSIIIYLAPEQARRVAWRPCTTAARWHLGRRGRHTGPVAAKEPTCPDPGTGTTKAEVLERLAGVAQGTGLRGTTFGPLPLDIRRDGQLQHAGHA